MQIHLKKGEKIYVNGAVLQVDRRASLRLLNDATFLLEAHIMQADQATSPLRQLYFVIQTMLMDPENAGATAILYAKMSANLKSITGAADVLEGLGQADQRVEAGRPFDALRIIRGLIAGQESPVAVPPAAQTASRAA
jgi:flagellar protein FlbT